MNPFLLPKGISLNNYPMSYLLSVSAVTYIFRTASRNTQCWTAVVRLIAQSCHPHELRAGSGTAQPSFCGTYAGMVNSRCGNWAVHLSPFLSFSESFPHAYVLAFVCITKLTQAIVSSMHGLVRVDKLSLYFQTTGAFPPLSNCLRSAHETQGTITTHDKWLVPHTPFTFF